MSTLSGEYSGSFSIPEIVEKSSPCRSGDASYNSLRHASVPESERGSSVVAILWILGSARFPQRLLARVRGAGEDEKQIREPVQVHGDEPVHLTGGDRAPFGAAADCAREEQPCGEF